MERFSDYSGYANSFEWKGAHLDVTPVDDYNRRYTTVVAIDALYYNEPKNQFKTKNLRRELHKVFKNVVPYMAMIFFNILVFSHLLDFHGGKSLSVLMLQ